MKILARSDEGLVSGHYLKDHPLSDGNKRSAAALFVTFLERNDLLISADGRPLVTNSALAAMTLMIALSAPREKDVMIALITRMISTEAQGSA